MDAPDPPPDTPDLSEFAYRTEVEELRAQVSKLQGQLRRVREHKEHLVQATFAGARDALLSLGPVDIVAPPIRDRRRSRAEVALWHLTDWQGSKVTTSYNTEVMHERVHRFCQKAAELTEIQRADHPVKECVIMFGGDLGEGLFNYPRQPFEIDSSLFGQFAATARLAAAVVRFALGLYESVEVIDEYGNHGRLGSKRAVVPGADNLDRMIYELARAILSDPATGKLHPRLVWEDNPEDIKRVEIGNYRALLIHGDEVGRNGFASPMTMVKHAAQWKSGAYPWAFRDVYVGHYHNHSEWALPDGEGALYQTGSTESDNRYAMSTMAAAARPTQRLHFIDPVKGRVTAQYKVFVD